MAPQHNIDELKRAHPIAEIAARHVKLTKEGDEFRGLCPFHKESSPSFTIYKDKGHCFGCGWHGDVVDFIRTLHQCSLPDALDILAGAAGATGGKAPGTIAPPAKEKKDDAPGLYDNLVPLETPEAALPGERHPLRCWNPKRDRWTNYLPSMVFVYRNSTAGIIGIVVRIDTGDGKKLTPTLRYVHLPSGEQAWSHMPFDKPRPLYGLDRIADTLGEIIWVEGEKATDAARRMFPACVITSPGGGKAIAQVDWSPLKGRAILFWGDADDEGEKTILGYERDGVFHPGAAALAYAAGAGPIRFREWDKTAPKGWDAADAEVEFNKAQVNTWLYRHTTKWEPDLEPIRDRADDRPRGADHSAPPAKETTQPGGSPPAARVAPPRDPPIAPFRILGHNRNVLFYQPFGTKTIIGLSANQHTISNLLMLAPLNYWAEAHPTRKAKFDAIDAVDALIRRAETVGIFDPERLRGRGAWIEGGKVIVNLGDRIIVDGQEKPLTSVSQYYIYEPGLPLDIDLGVQATTKEANHMVDLFKRFNWLDPMSGELLAGLCIAMQVCGALPWRPHGWIVGPSESGKSTALGLARRVIGMIAQEFRGGSTEAGVRQTLFHDSRPGIFDEFEHDTEQAADVVNRILALVRVASDGGTISKGSSEGTAVHHTVQSSFLFCSINPKLSAYADLRRVSKFAMRPLPKKQREAHYKAWLADANAWIGPDYAARIFARTIANLNTYLANVRTFAAAASAALQNSGAGDQLAPMLAGLFLCHSTKLISYEAAIAWIEARNWSEHVAIDVKGDPLKIIEAIATLRVRVNTAGGLREQPIGRLMESVADKVCMKGVNMTIEETQEALGDYGIKILDADYFVIANHSDSLTKALKGQAWAEDWRTLLRGIPGAKATPTDRFAPGLNARGTRLRLSLIRTGENPPAAFDLDEIDQPPDRESLH